MGKRVLTVTEMARMGGLAAAGKLDKKRRREICRDAYLAGAVNTVIRRYGDLTEEQRERLTDFVVERLAS